MIYDSTMMEFFKYLVSLQTYMNYFALKNKCPCISNMRVPKFNNAIENKHSYYVNF